jgi:hypothetical protein
MGLDAVEFVMAVEQAFGIAIPDQVARDLITPKDLVDYLERTLGSGNSPACMEQRAFHDLRAAAMKVLECPRVAFTPDTSWADLLHEGQHAREWQLLSDEVGIKPWPRLKPLLSWHDTKQRVGDTARALATTSVASLLREHEGWSRATIEQLVCKLMGEELGISKFAWTDRFVKDLGVD